jgi:hypothetical protein
VRGDLAAGIVVALALIPGSTTTTMVRTCLVPVLMFH